MTRINVIPPSDLTDQHLAAEYRELPRCFGLVPRKGDPSTYRMGAGHVRFFADKPNWLRHRQAEIIKEMVDRGFSPRYTAPEPTGPVEWVPSPDAIDTNLERLRLRLADKPHYYRYCGDPVWSDFY